MKSIFIALLFVISSCLYSQNSPFVSDVEKVTTFASEAVTLAPSWVKQREVLNLDYLKSLELDRLLPNFRLNAGLPSNAKPLYDVNEESYGVYATIRNY